MDDLPQHPGQCGERSSREKMKGGKGHERKSGWWQGREGLKRKGGEASHEEGGIGGRTKEEGCEESTEEWGVSRVGMRGGVASQGMRYGGECMTRGYCEAQQNACKSSL